MTTASIKRATIRGHAVRVASTALKLVTAFASIGSTVGCHRNKPNSQSGIVAPRGKAENNQTIAAGVSAAEQRVRNSPREAILRTNLAHEYFSIGEAFAGIEQMEIQRKLAPQANKSVLAELASWYDSIGEPEKAAEVLEAGGPDPDMAPNLSKIYLKLGDFRRSAEVLSLPLPPGTITSPETQQSRVRALLLAGDTRSTLALIPQSNDPDWLVLAGIRALEDGQPGEGIKPLMSSLEKTNDPWTGYLLAKCYLAINDETKAFATLNQIVQNPTAPALALCQFALLASKLGRASDADATLDRVRGEDRRLPLYWRAAAAVAHQNGHFDVEKVSLGYSEYNAGDPWAAETLWQGVAKAGKSEVSRQASVALTNSALRRQDPDTALKFASDGVKRWPKDPETLRLYAETLLAMSQPDQAIGFGLQFMAVAPEEKRAQAAELLCRIALDSNKPDLLAENAAMAHALAPADPMPLLHQAEWQAKQGKDDATARKTLALYERAGAASPRSAEAAAHAGLIMADLKQDSEAAHTLLHALSLNPRVLDGAPNVVLVKLYQHEGRLSESEFEADWYRRVRSLKESWPTLLKTMRQSNPSTSAADWKSLGELALQRHENWIALCAFQRLTKLSPSSSIAWSDLAAAEKRFGWFDEALAAMHRSNALSASGHGAT